MSMHQIILTGKKCGLYGQEGFGILSCDRGFDNVKDALAVSNAYRAPSIGDAGSLASVCPQSYTYRPLGQNLSAASLCTCLKDTPYVGGQNHICHMITFKNGGTEFYPCDYIGSSSFISEPDAATVDDDAGLDYLESPDLVPGREVTLNKAMKFLSLDGNFEIFRNMLYALCSRKTAKKRLIICDEYESSVLWLAALNYALPVGIAQKVSFTTYAYSPDEADVDICCVLPKHTAYNDSFDGSDKYFVFDILRGKYPVFDFSSAVESHYSDFLQDAFTHDYGLLVDFFAFIGESTGIIEPTPDFSSAYLMYHALQSDVTALTFDEFRNIMMFTVNYSDYASKLRLTERILKSASQVLRFDVPFMILTLKFMSGVYKDASLRVRQDFHGMLIDAVPVTAIARGMTSGAFDECYKELTAIAEMCGIDLVIDLMAPTNTRSLKIVVTYQPALWKNEFVLGLISAYVKKKNMGEAALDPKEPVGAFLCEILKDAFSDRFGQESAEYILNEFTFSEPLFIACERSAETALAGNPSADALVAAVRDAFFRIAADKLFDRRNVLFDTLSTGAGDKYALIWGIINEMFGVCEPKKIHALFSEHYQKYFRVYPEYASAYLGAYVERYLAVARSLKGDAVKTAEDKCFDVYLENSLVTASSASVTADIIAALPLSEPSKDSAKQINRLAGYERDVRGCIISGKLLCLCFGLCTLDIRHRKDYTELKPSFERLTANGAVDLTPYSDTDVEKYLQWALEPLVENAPPEDCGYVYGLLRMPSHGSVVFAEAFAEEYLRVGKNNSSYTEFCTFLSFLFTKCGMEETQAVADEVRKLNSKRLEQLRTDAEAAFASDYTLMERFNAMLNMEPTKKSFFSKLFKK